MKRGKWHTDTSNISLIIFSDLEQLMKEVMQVDPKELPTYSKGAHMNGPDILNYEQAQAEFVRSSPFTPPSQ